MNYIEELSIKRRANVTNVYILETSDPRRIAQLVETLKERAEELFAADKQYDILLLDLQLGEFVNVRTGFRPRLDPMQPIHRQVYQHLSTKPGIIIAKYVYEARHAQMLSDVMAAASHDTAVYDNKSTLIVFASSAELFNATLRRLAHTIAIPASTPEERRAILEAQAKKLEEGYKQMYGVDIKIHTDGDLIQASAGLNLHQVETAALESFFKARDFKVEVFTEYKAKMLKEERLEYIVPSRGFESVGGYGYIKDYIAKRVVKPLRNPEVAQRYGLGVPKGILLYGPPGTGKSWLCKALAKEIGLPMISLSAKDLLRGIVGETEARIAQVTRMLEDLAPCVVFIDEFDQLTLSRETTMITDSGVSRRMVNMLLEWLGRETRRTFIVGATNHVSHIDRAFLRPGRLDEVIPVLPPDHEARLEIFRVHTEVVRRVPVKDVDFNALANATYMWTGAEIEKLIIEASSLAMDEDAEAVEQRHFEAAMESMEVNIQEREQHLQDMVEELKRLENVNRRFLNEALKFWASKERSDRVTQLLKSLR